MKKNTIKIVSGISVLLILIGATVLLMLPSNSDTEENTFTGTDYKTYTIFSESVDNMKEITVDYDDMKLSSRKDEEGNWLINNLPLADIDTSKSRGFAESVASIYSSTVIAENSENLSEYGLDFPSVTVTVTKNDDTVSKIFIGNASPVNGNYFIKNETDDAIYSVTPYKFEALTKNESYYTEFERFSIADVYTINKIVIERPDVTIALSKAEGKVQSYYDSWNMTSPISTSANDDYIHDYVIEKIKTISLVKPIENGDFGFDKATATLTLNIRPYDEKKQQYQDEYTEKLVIGKMTEGRYYVQYEGKAYQVSEESLGFVNSTVLNLSSKLQAMFKIADVERVDMEYNGENHTLQILHINDEGDYSFKIDGKDIDPDDAKQLYQKLIGVLANGLYKGEALGESVLTLNYKGYNGASDNTVEFKALNDLECAIVKNGNAQFTVSKSVIKGLIDIINSNIAD